MNRKEMFAKQYYCTYEAAHSCKELKKYQKSSTNSLNARQISSDTCLKTIKLNQKKK